MSNYRELISSGLFPANALEVLFPYLVSIPLSLIKPIILLDLKNKDRKVCCRTRLNDGIFFINSQNNEQNEKLVEVDQKENI